MADLDRQKHRCRYRGDDGTAASNRQSLPRRIFFLTTAIPFPPGVIFCSRFIMDHELVKIYYHFDWDEWTKTLFMSKTDPAKPALSLVLWRLPASTFLPHLDILECRKRALELVVEQPHRIEDFAEGRGGSCPVGLAKGEDAVVAQISHDRRVGNAIAEQIA